ncbi:hypothetical protein IWW38_001886 [Coemansia aciculifera]|uniref:Uncharacterized protein n=1 Tax=Coemansia aciculifera TaxID=417176 RepID=A0ACC1M517_9FUNG|nr:hypothetical protein IWW38_001886 [Coemansia aciculifera]
MGRSGLLGADPNEAYRKKAQEREAKRNKEVRDKMRSVAVLHKDTTKMERKIEQYRKIVRVRKMTAAEREKLQAMEAELKDVLDKQKAAGIAPKKRDAASLAIGYDPMAAAAEAEESGARRMDVLSSDSEDDNAMLDQINELDDIPAEEIGIAHGGVGVDADPLPPMPPGTPPLLPEDLGFGQVWPPLPSGPSPLYLQHHRRPQPSQQDTDSNREHSQRPPPRAPYRLHQHQHRHSGNERQGQRAHPYAHPNASIHSRPVMTGVPLNQPPPVPLGYLRPPTAAAVPSATVLAAEPQVRNLKRELTTLVPAAIARKTKQKERQQVLASVPMVPKMIVNAAPDVDTDSSSSSHAARAPSSSAAAAVGILGAMRPLPGVRFTTLPAAKPQQETKSKSTLDDEYQKFVEQMNDLL